MESDLVGFVSRGPPVQECQLHVHLQVKIINVLNVKIFLISFYTFILNIDTPVGCFGKWQTPIYLQDSRIVSFYAKTNLNCSY